MIVFVAGVSNLLLVVGVSLAAGVGVTAVFSLAIVGAVRSADSRRARRRRAEIGWGVLSVLSVLGVLIAVAGGLRILVG